MATAEGGKDGVLLVTSMEKVLLLRKRTGGAGVRPLSIEKKSYLEVRRTERKNGMTLTGTRKGGRARGAEGWCKAAKKNCSKERDTRGGGKKRTSSRLSRNSNERKGPRRAKGAAKGTYPSLDRCSGGRKTTEWVGGKGSQRRGTADDSRRRANRGGKQDNEF